MMDILFGSPEYPSYRPPVVEINRPAANAINRLENKRQTEMYSGFGGVVPVVYGEQVVSGPRLVDPWPTGSSYIWAVALSHGPIEGILQARANGGAWVSMPATTASQVNLGNGAVLLTRYDGTQTAVNAALAAAIPGFADALLGIAYVVVRFDVQTASTSLPEVEFRIRGRRVKDPRTPVGIWASLDAGFEGATIRALASGGTTSANRTLLAGGDGGRLASQQGAGAWEMRAAGFGTSAVLAVANASSSNWGAAGSAGTTARGANSNANNWNQIPPLAGWGDMHAAAFGRNMHLVGGAAGMAATRSTTGTSWSAANSGMGASTIRAALGTNSMLMLAGDDGKLATNTSGTTWVLRDPGFGGSSITVLATDGSLYVAGTADGKIASSADGIAWTVGMPPFALGVGVTAIAAGEGLWVAASDDGRIATSKDFLTWQVHASPTGAIVRAMIHTGDQFVIAGDGGSIAAGTNLLGEIWTENPALHMADFTGNSYWGLGREMQGVTAAADACDSLYSGVPRSRTGLTIQDSMTERDALNLLAEYAEVLWGFDGDIITLVPDMPVQQMADAITADQIIEGTLALTAVASNEMPTQVAIIFTDRSDSGDWTTRPAMAVLPTDAESGSEDTRSDVRLPGVFRRIEADRRAWQRLIRMQTPGRFAWQMHGIALKYQPGDAVPLPDIRGLQSIAVRITAQPELIGPGRYQLQGELYNPDLYPGDGGGTALPVGAIVPYTGALPDGFAPWSKSGFLIGDETGGQSLAATSGNITLSFAQAGGHVGTRETVARAGSSGGTPTGIMLANTASDQVRGAHPHSATLAQSTLLNAAPMESVTWAKKTGSAAPLRAGIGFLAAQAIKAQRITAVMSAVGRYLASGPRSSRSAQEFITGQTSEDGEHHHGGDLFELGAGSGTLTLFYPTGKHRHAWTARVSARLRSRRMAHYQATDEALVPVGGIVGWEDGAVPSGWRLCNGQNGTVDLRGFFIELSEPARAGGVASEVSQITLTSITTDSLGLHNHKRTVNNANIVNFGSSGRHDLENHFHAHSAPDRTLNNVLPARHTLRFIQYVGA